MRMKSVVTDRFYNPEEMVYIVNAIQTAKYLKNGAVLYDLFESDSVLVAAFSRKETKTLYEKWMRHEL